MKATAKEENRATNFLRKYNIRVEDISSFRFMQRYTPQPDKHSKENLYGSGILTLQLKSGKEKALIVHLRQHPTALIHFLLSRGISFDNCRTGSRQTSFKPQPAVYKRMSLYMFWYFILFIICLGLGFHTTTLSLPAGILLPVVFFGMALYCMYLLQTRFCYLKIEADRLTIVSAGREIHCAYDDLVKVNFDFAREPNATHIMEMLDSAYRYRLFYIGRVPRTQLNQLAALLQQAGIDATCSLNDEKRHYHDVFHG